MRKHIVLMAAMAIALVGTSVANAGFSTGVGGFTGNSQFLIGNANSDGIVNFGVFIPSTSNWLTELAPQGLTTSNVNFFGPSVKASAYVYFYQVVNTDPVPNVPPIVTPDAALEHLQIETPLTNSVITSTGYITNTVFQDNTTGSSGPTGPGGTAATNRLGFLLGSAPSPGDAAQPFPTGAPSEYYVDPTDPGFVTDLSAIEPTGSQAISSSSILQFDFAAGGSIPNGSYSSIVFFTSNYAPQYFDSHLQDGASTTNELPSPFGAPGIAPTPEPTAFVMLCGVLICGIVGLAYKKHAKLVN